MSFLKRLWPARPVGTEVGSPANMVLAVLAGQRRRVEPSLPPPTAPGKMRIHLFAGDFASQGAAWHYCFYQDNNRPEDITRDLPDAYIDTTHVEARYGDYEARLDEFLLPGDVADVVSRMAGANTLVIIAEPAFGGIAYALNDTPRLRYLGPLVVNV